MTDPHVHRLRELLVAAFAEINAMEGAPVVPVVARDGLVSIVDAALHLGLRYDACRMLARRAGALVKFGARRYVWRGWLETQNVRSERTSERKCSHERRG